MISTARLLVSRSPSAEGTSILIIGMFDGDADKCLRALKRVRDVGRGSMPTNPRPNFPVQVRTSALDWLTRRDMAFGNVKDCQLLNTAFASLL